MALVVRFLVGGVVVSVCSVGRWFETEELCRASRCGPSVALAETCADHRGRP